ncbi:MAG: molybdopterin-dependent oxidoreductase [Planctomycetota bacterium]|nr:molybdopterin-dependent oxidoreductase [Planctomycetota bacterium]MDA1178368.1 molybdopterin-dependent oxidoreductase [Planctomycetota bacterium]
MVPAKSTTELVTLRIDGEVNRPVDLSYYDLSNLEHGQVHDISRLVPSRQGDAITLLALLEVANAKPTATYLGLHSSTDNFHASIPLESVRSRGLLIYRVQGQPLRSDQGGPFRFFIPDHDQCHTSEVDECANVKYVDRLELTQGKGFDNRPQDEQQHAALHH